MSRVVHRTDRLGELERRSRGGRPSSWSVSVLTGRDAGKTVLLTDPLLVGSGDDCNFVLTDTSVSRHHVRLEAREDGVFLEDLGSTNGTLVGGARIESGLIAEHAVINLGRTTLTVRAFEAGLAESGPERLGSLVAVSASMRRVFGLVERLAPATTAVVLVGENGTGRRSLARSLHALSPRATAPLVVVNCSALAPHLVERELFGDGATPGAFAAAAGGTLFLEDIAGLPLDQQARLVKLLERSPAQQVTDVRLLSSARRPLELEVREGRLLPELSSRVGVAAVRVPALRERREDLPRLITALVAELGRESFELTDELLARFATWDWPGNVLELRNVIERAMATESVSLDPMLNPEPIATPGQTSSQVTDVPFKQAKEQLVDGFTREYLKALVVRHDGNVSQMARSSGLARTYVHELLTKYGLAYRNLPEK